MCSYHESAYEGAKRRTVEYISQFPVYYTPYKHVVLQAIDAKLAATEINMYATRYLTCHCIFQCIFAY